MLTFNGRKIYFGSFDNEIYAAKIYDKAALNIHGLEVSLLNQDPSKFQLLSQIN